MWTRQRPFDEREEELRRAALGSDLEDLLVHVMNCERWARFDDRLQLAISVEQARPAPRRRRR